MIGKETEYNAAPVVVKRCLFQERAEKKKVAPRCSVVSASVVPAQERSMLGD